MDIALTLREYNEKCDSIFSALESYMSYIDLIDDDSDDDIFPMLVGTEGRSSKNTQTTENVDSTKENKKKAGIGAALKSIGQTIISFFKSLFGIGKNKDIPDNIKYAWPRSVDGPDKLYDKMEKDMNKIMSLIQNGADVATVDNMLKNFIDNTSASIDDVKMARESMKKMKNSGRNGKKTVGTWILGKLPIPNRVRQINKAVSKYNGASKKEVEVIKAYQKLAMELASVIKTCQVNNTDTSTVTAGAEKAYAKAEKRIDRKIKGADKRFDRYERKAEKVERKDQKYYDKHGQA